MKSLSVKKGLVVFSIVSILCFSLYPHQSKAASIFDASEQAFVSTMDSFTKGLNILPKQTASVFSSIKDLFGSLFGSTPAPEAPAQPAPALRERDANIPSSSDQLPSSSIEQYVNLTGPERVVREYINEPNLVTFPQLQIQLTALESRLRSGLGYSYPYPISTPQGDYVTMTNFENQVDAIYSSFEDSLDNVASDIDDAVDGVSVEADPDPEFDTLTVDGTVTFGSLTGLLQSVNGLVSASSTVSVAYGGTGLSTSPSYGNVLVGNAAGGYTLTATSSLGLMSLGSISSSATGLSYNSSSGVFSFTSGYNIPLTASTTNWNTFYDTPSNRITNGTGLTWASNTLNCVAASGVQAGCLSSADWTSFNDKVSSQWTTTGSSIYYPTSGVSDSVGVGTTTPRARFAVSGGSGATIPVFLVSTSTSLFSTTTVFQINSQGNTIIGATTSALTSDVLTVHGTLRMTHSNPNSDEVYIRAGTTTSSNSGMHLVLTGGSFNDANGAELQVRGSQSSNGGGINLSAAGGSSFNSGGNVNLNAGSAGNHTGSSISVSGASSSEGGGMSFNAGFTNGGRGGTIQIQGGSGSSRGYINLQESGGNVGIGSSTPSAILSVKGAGTGTGRLFALSDSSNTERLSVLDNGNTIIGATTTSYVGDVLTVHGTLRLTHSSSSNDEAYIKAGTTTTGNGMNLFMRGGDYGDSLNGAEIQLRGSSANSGGGISLQAAGNGSVNNGGNINLNAGTAGSHSGASLSVSGANSSEGGTINLQAGFTNSGRGGKIQLQGGSGSSRGYITLQESGGNVGIGTSSPVVELAVVGSACISQGQGVGSAACSTTDGTITATVFNTASADVAERYKVEDTSIKAGEIVALDLTAPLTVKRARSGDKIFGIISTAPGVLLGSTNLEDATTRPVALAGRVPVKFSDENGSVSIGDSLVLSNTPGVAMKAPEEGGYIIGTALERMTHSGMVTVFVQTQFTNNLVQSISLPPIETVAESEMANVFDDLLSGVEQWMYGKVSATVGFFKHLFVDTLTANNLEIKGRDGNIYCVIVDEDGDLRTVEGRCDDEISDVESDDEDSEVIIEPSEPVEESEESVEETTEPTEEESTGEESSESEEVTEPEQEEVVEESVEEVIEESQPEPEPESEEAPEPEAEAPQPSPEASAGDASEQP